MPMIGAYTRPVREDTPTGSPQMIIKTLKQWDSIGVDRMVFRSIPTK
jgi:hypothetical protein